MKVKKRDNHFTNAANKLWNGISLTERDWTENKVMEQKVTSKRAYPQIKGDKSC